MRYFGNRAEVELVSDADVVRYDLQPGVTSDVAAPQPIEGGSHSTLRFSPGAYRIEAKCKPGRVVERWEVTTHGLFNTRTQERDGASLLLAVARGERLTVRPVLRDAPPAPSPKSEDRWVSLFNSKDLAGWRQPLGQGVWEVVDGVLTGTAGAGEYGCLPTIRDYTNFELRAEVRLTGPGNSGILFRSENGYQVEIDDGTSGSIARSEPFAWLRSFTNPV